MNKEYVSNGGVYFSGQGYVSLETEEKIFELGNCTDLVFYNDGSFSLVWEKFYDRNIELLLGDSCGEKSFVPLGKEKEYTYDKFTINKGLKRKFILHFNGVNTADSDRPFVVKTNVEIGMVEFLPLINDELAAFITNGEWLGELEFFISKTGYTEQSTTYRPSIKLPLAKQKLSACGNLIKLLTLNDKDKYEISGVFNPKKIVTVREVVSFEKICTKISLVDGLMVLAEMPIQDVTNFLERFNTHKVSKIKHQEKRTGLRLVDYVYEPSNNNKINTGKR